MLLKKRKKRDPFLIEVQLLRENIAKEVAQLKMKASAVKKKKTELDAVAQIVGINTYLRNLENHQQNSQTCQKRITHDTESKETPSDLTEVNV